MSNDKVTAANNPGFGLISKRYNPNVQQAPSVLGFPADNAGCGHYRMRLPFQLGTAMGIIRAEAHSWFFTSLNNNDFFDTIIFQRQCTDTQLKYFRLMLRYAKAIRKPLRVVYELDDIVHEIHKESTIAHRFYTPEHCENVLSMMREADEVSFSTPYLQQYYARLGVNRYRVIPNTLPKFLWQFPHREKVPSQENRWKILWTGSSTHHGASNDTAILRYIVSQITKRYGKRVEWVFFGTAPGFVQNDAAVRVVPWVDFYTYPQALYALDATIGVVPLVDIPFNYGKSDLKLLEFGAVGLPSVFSDIGPNGPYVNAPVKVENSPKMWVESICNLLEDDVYYAAVRESHYQYITNRWLEDNIQQWVDFYTGGATTKRMGTFTAPLG